VLILSRKVHESVVVDDRVLVTFLSMDRNTAVLKFESLKTESGEKFVPEGVFRFPLFLPIPLMENVYLSPRRTDSYSQISLAFEAPRSISIDRQELWVKKRQKPDPNK
jgi:sRNA-binding carbon storage regulator CsrA